MTEMYPYNLPSSNGRRVAFALAWGLVCIAAGVGITAGYSVFAENKCKADAPPQIVPLSSDEMSTLEEAGAKSFSDLHPSHIQLAHTALGPVIDAANAYEGASVQIQIPRRVDDAPVDPHVLSGAADVSVLVDNWAKPDVTVLLPKVVAANADNQNQYAQVVITGTCPPNLLTTVLP